MKKSKIILFIILSLFINCKKEKIKIEKQTKFVQIYAENDYGMFGKINLKIYSDNTYNCVRYETSPNYEKTEKFNGFLKIVNDTINFFPFDFKPNYSTKAVIKNNFVEFVDGEYPLKIEIKRSKLNSKNSLKFDKIKDYAIFTFNEKYHSNIYYGYKPKLVKAYDLKQKELEELDTILKKCFVENNSKLKDIDNYVKQCIVVINSKKEIEVWVSCYCKNKYEKDNYKYSIIQMHDGGNCNINLKVNLTNHNYSELNISGSA
ncbi:hypothetical protein [Flavobacterium branchiophilum]|uniref:Uncharacterized protein n=1 Tax=Flavobacterium branchiophilum TaxID=55197 RepID=A0A2H3KYW5_9FLAO|nr:hypothetical protein [Flavobacterium branchiophilum]PDS24948.1 hypothetical protein B0A77_06740 [Flavobacterium branchiophilum]